MIISATSPQVLCMYKFVLSLFSLLLFFFLLAKVAANISVFEFPVGLYDWKTTTAHPTVTFMFQNILRTFEAELLQIFKNIQPQLKNWKFLYMEKSEPPVYPNQR